MARLPQLSPRARELAAAALAQPDEPAAERGRRLVLDGPPMIPTESVHRFEQPRPPQASTAQQYARRLAIIERTLAGLDRGR